MAGAICPTRVNAELFFRGIHRRARYLWVETHRPRSELVGTAGVLCPARVNAGLFLADSSAASDDGYFALSHYYGAHISGMSRASAPARPGPPALRPDNWTRAIITYILPPAAGFRTCMSCGLRALTFF